MRGGAPADSSRRGPPCANAFATKRLRTSFPLAVSTRRALINLPSLTFSASALSFCVDVAAMELVQLFLVPP